MRLPALRLSAALLIAIAGAPALPTSTASAASAPVLAQPGKTVDLRPKFKVGDVHRFKMVVDTKGTTGPAATPDEQTVHQEIGLKLTVRDVTAESGAVLELEYESLLLDLKMAGMAVKFDSTRPPAQDDSPVAAALRPIVGTKLNVRTDAQGNITAVSGGESLNQGPSAMLAGQFTGADVIKNMFGPIVALKKGDGTVSVGETWTNQTQMDAAMGRMEMTTNNTLRSASGGKATIDITGSLTLNNANSSAAMPSIAIKDSTIKGQAIWDTETGMLNSMQTEQKLLVEQGSGPDAARSQHEMKMSVTRAK